MGDVIQLRPKKKKLLVDKKRGTIDSNQMDRLLRIKASINKINELMKQLKIMTQEERAQLIKDNEERMKKDRTAKNKAVLRSYRIKH